MKNEQTSNPWTDRERDSTTTLWGVLVIFYTLIILLFISEWFFRGEREEPYLDPMLIGILIGASSNWITAAVKDFFEKKRTNPAQNGDEAPPPNKGVTKT